MPAPRRTLKNLMIQAQLNKFYSHPVARVSTGLVLTIVAIIFFALVAIRPTLQTMAELIRSIDDKKIVDQKLSQKIASLSSAQAELASKQTAAQIIDIAIPSTPHFTLLLREVEKLISVENVSLISLIAQSVPVERDSAKSNINQLESLPLTLTLSGSYSDLMATLKGLYGMQRIMVIDRVDLLPPSDQDTTTLTMSVALRAFAFGDDPALTKKLKALGNQ